MAETAVTTTQLVLGTVPTITLGDGTAIDADKTTVVTPLGPLNECLIVIVNTTNAEKVTTITAGSNPPADAAGQGDLTVTLGAGDSTNTFTILQLDAARFLHHDGTVHMEHADSMTGFVNALQLPKGAR